MLSTLKKMLGGGKPANEPAAVAADHGDTIREGYRFQATGQLDRAEAFYRRVIEDDPCHVDALYLLGELLLAGNRAQEALAVLSPVSSQVQAEQIYLALAKALYACGRAQEAAEQAYLVLGLDADVPEGYFLLGLCCQTLGTLADAENHYRRAIALHAGYGEALNSLGNLLKELGRHDEAVEVYRQAVSAMPGVPGIHYNFGEALLRRGDYDGARGSLQRALEIDPHFFPALMSLAGVHVSLKEPDAAERYVCRARELMPESADAFIAEAHVSFLRKDYRSAEEIYRRVLRGVPENVHALNGLGSSLVELNRADEAHVLLEAAVRLMPSFVKAYGNLGLAYKKLGQLENFSGAYAISAGKRAQLPGVTLCSVDCLYPELAARALLASASQCECSRVVLFSDRKVAVPGVEVVIIPPIRSIAEYSEFMVKRLGPHIGTSHALIIQYDGFVLDGGKWDPAWLAYDYVGAPWNRKDGCTVGNGGFSLRSKRLLDALQDTAINDLTPEDLAICCTYRPLLEGKYGMQFAPEAEARRFSFEEVPPFSGTFGFHGIGHLTRLGRMNETERGGFLQGKTDLYGR